MGIVEPDPIPCDPDYPCPTSADLDDPMFDAIWQSIKKWDISRRVGHGYSVATGNDVMHILNAIRKMEK